MRTHAAFQALRRIDADVVIWLGIILLSAIIAILNLLFGGNLAAAFGLVAAVLVVIVSVLRPSVGLYLLVFLALAIEQGEMDYSWTLGLGYHINLGVAYPSLKGLSINPLEIHLLCILAGLLLRWIVVNGREEKVPILAKTPLLLYFVSVIAFTGYGLARGGSLFSALWEVRGIFYMFLLMFIVPQVIRNEKQIGYVMWSIILGLGFRTLEVCVHYASANFTLSGSEGGWGNHEDAGLLATLLIFTLALYVLKAKGQRQRRVLTFLFIPMIIAIIASDRRTVYIILAATVVLLPLMMPREIQRKLLKFVGVIAVLGVIYLTAFWETKSNNPLMRPAQLIREGVMGDEDKTKESYTSNLYRKVENFDLYRMIREQPLFGIGYGALIDYRLPLPIQWELGFYIPHNQILSVLAKTGIVGFIIFMMFYLSILDEIARGFARVADSHNLRALLVLAAAAVVNHLIFSYFDIMLTYYRNNVYLGTILGLVAAILALETQRKLDEAPLPPLERTYDAPAKWLLKANDEPVSQSQQ